MLKGNDATYLEFVVGTSKSTPIIAACYHMGSRRSISPASLSYTQ